jgi:cytochrome c biogenesis protein
MLSTLTLLRDGREVRRQTIRLNHPLTHGGLVVLPASFGRSADGFSFLVAGHGIAPLQAGGSLSLEGGTALRAVRFYPHAARLADGGAALLGEDLGDPAIELELLRPNREPWRGWYFLREGLPYPLVEAGVRLWPAEPLYRVYSVLTVNRDPGAGLALLGAVLMGCGVVFALGSFYYKRARGDRPDIA